MSDLIASLRQMLESKPAPEGYTITELLEQLGLPDTKDARKKISGFLKTEVAAGRVQARMGKRMNIVGFWAGIPVYIPVRPLADVDPEPADTTTTLDPIGDRTRDKTRRNHGNR